MGSEMLDAMKGYAFHDLWFATTRVPAVDTFPPEIDPEVAEAPWSVAEWAVAPRFENPRATVPVLVLG